MATPLACDANGNAADGAVSGGRILFGGVTVAGCFIPG